MARYTPRFLVAAKRRYEDTDEPMPLIAFNLGISLRTLHRMVDREGWRKRNDRPPKDLTSADLLLEAAVALARGEFTEALLQQFRQQRKLEQERLRQQGLLPYMVR
jgi:hypothetical protein